jgi:molecular chaperone DnaJ
MGIRQGNMQFVASCDSCGGSGKIITDSCRPCGGAGKVRDKAIVDVDIPMGIPADSTLRVSRKGNAPLSGNGVAGDLYITISVTPSRVFTRVGNDVSVKIKIPIHKAILGGEISIPTLEGSEAKIKIQPGTQDGTKLVVRNRGIQSTGHRGDLWAVVHLEVPT